MGAGRMPAERLAQAGELTVAQAAEALGVSETTVYRLLRESRDGEPSLVGSKRRGCCFVSEESICDLRSRFPNFASAE